MRSIRSRLLIGYGSLVLVMAALSLVAAAWTSRAVQGHFEAAVNTDSRLRAAIDRRLDIINDEQILVENFVLTGRASYVRLFHRRDQALRALRHRTAFEARDVPEIKPMLAVLSGDERRWYRWADWIVREAARHRTRAWIRQAINRGHELGVATDRAVLPVFAVVSARQQNDLRRGLWALNAMNLLRGGLLIAGVLVVLAIAAIVTRAMTKPLQYLADRADAIAAGDLDHKIDVDGAAEFRALGNRMEQMRRRLQHDLSQRKSFEQRLRHQALHDSLTGLPNRTVLSDRLDHAMLAARHTDDSVALVVLDLNRFKHINDSLGHDAGDRLLQEAAARLRSSLRQTDTVARFGGDEFAVVMPGLSRRHVEQTVGKILTALHTPLNIREHQIDIDASIGIALFPEHGDSADVLLRHADVAMYSAKRGRRAFALYSPEQDLTSARHLALAAQLRQAIDGHDITLHFQPIVSVETGRTERVEALARWKRAEDEYIPPDQFIPLAEETGLIAPLTRSVLRGALVHCSAWRLAGLDLGVGVNLSSSSLSDPELPGMIETALGDAGLSGDALMIEITESALLEKPDEARKTLERLHAQGVRLAIDDFGTGYSSLSYLQKLPVDAIKIDRSFVQHMTEDDRTIVRAVIDLGKHLNLDVTAEGVETWETWMQLREMECPSAQGYLISPPLTGEEVRSWMETHAVTSRRSRLRIVG
ncbi:MAG TPA: EAL domain-containing protein [Chloroflexota bacterium]|nr:EAL domain-containing protein [Chloroflexota bacterium]